MGLRSDPRSVCCWLVGTRVGSLPHPSGGRLVRYDYPTLDPVGPRVHDTLVAPQTSDSSMPRPSEGFRQSRKSWVPGLCPLSPRTGVEVRYRTSRRCRTHRSFGSDCGLGEGCRRDRTGLRPGSPRDSRNCPDSWKSYWLVWDYKKFQSK